LALCALLTARLVYRYDLYEHEPIPLLGVAIGLGAGAMWLAGAVEGWILSRAQGPGPLEIAAVAAATEEALKVLVVVVVALLAHREFDDPMDGVVYGSMTGLGAALEESVFYAGSSAAGGAGFPAGELVRLWAHVVLGGIAGFSLGFWRARPPLAALATGGLLGVAMALHFGWDAIVLSIPDGFPPTPAQSLAGVALMVTSLVLYGRLVTLASARSRQQFAPHSRQELWGWPFDRLVRRWQRRAGDESAAELSGRAGGATRSGRDAS
jgi:RsiW-degrading membrane proteinase PrsW (M82 family)